MIYKISTLLFMSAIASSILVLPSEFALAQTQHFIAFARVTVMLQLLAEVVGKLVQ